MTDPTNPQGASPKLPPGRHVTLWLSDTQTPIPPALTPDEWAGYYGGTLLQVPRNPAASMALCNAALPDDDPRKLRQTDVAMLRNVAGDYETPNGHVMTGRLLLALAAKLAALLPPEAK